MNKKRKKKRRRRKKKKKKKERMMREIRWKWWRSGWSSGWSSRRGGRDNQNATEGTGKRQLNLHSRMCHERGRSSWCKTNWKAPLISTNAIYMRGYRLGWKREEMRVAMWIEWPPQALTKGETLSTHKWSVNKVTVYQVMYQLMYTACVWLLVSMCVRLNRG